MRGWAIVLAVLVVTAALSGLSLTFGLLFASALLSFPLPAALGSLALLILLWLLDRRWTGTWALRAGWLGVHLGGVVAMMRFFTAFGEGSQ